MLFKHVEYTSKQIKHHLFSYYYVCLWPHGGSAVISLQFQMQTLKYIGGSSSTSREMGV